MARPSLRDTQYNRTLSIFICSLVCERKGHNLQELTRRVQNYLYFDTFMSQRIILKKDIKRTIDMDKSFGEEVFLVGLMISH